MLNKKLKIERKKKNLQTHLAGNATTRPRRPHLAAESECRQPASIPFPCFVAGLRLERLVLVPARGGAHAEERRRRRHAEVNQRTLPFDVPPHWSPCAFYYRCSEIHPENRVQGAGAFSSPLPCHVPAGPGAPTGAAAAAGPRVARAKSIGLQTRCGHHLNGLFYCPERSLQ